MSKKVDIEDLVVRIKARIAAGHYQHGFLNEAALARLFGVKRGHIRQAMHKLNLTGVVLQRTRHRGTRYNHVRSGKAS